MRRVNMKNTVDLSGLDIVRHQLRDIFDGDELKQIENWMVEDWGILTRYIITNGWLSVMSALSLKNRETR